MRYQLNTREKLIQLLSDKYISFFSHPEEFSIPMDFQISSLLEQSKTFFNHLLTKGMFS
jgi:hypothetical protein